VSGGAITICGLVCVCLFFRGAIAAMATAKRESRKLELDDEVIEFEPMGHPGHLVRRLHQICVSVFLEKSSQYGLTHLQFAALLAIEYAPGIDQGRLGKLIAIDRQTTSNVVGRLSEKGLLDKRRKDRRTNALYLTGPGRALIHVMQPYVPEIDDTILKPLSDPEREMFMKLLAKLVHDNNGLSRAPQNNSNL
jgi:DNA-binding MarR family transcriptional regulator